MTPDLTMPELEMLRLICCWRMPVCPVVPSERDACAALAQHGLVARSGDTASIGHYTATNAGREWLAAHDKEPA